MMYVLSGGNPYGEREVIVRPWTAVDVTHQSFDFKGEKEKQTELMIITRSSLDQARSHLLTERRIKMNEENDENEMKKSKRYFYFSFFFVNQSHLHAAY